MKDLQALGRVFLLVVPCLLVPVTAGCQTRFEATLYAGLIAFFGADPVGFGVSIPDARSDRNVTEPSAAGVAPSYTLAVAARFRVARRLGVEVLGTWAPTSVTPKGSEHGADLTITGVTGGGVLYLPLHSSHLEPFVVIGGGVRIYKAFETVAYPSWSVGGGLAVPIEEGFELRFEVRNYMAISDIADFQPMAMPNPSDHRFQSDLALMVGATFY